MTTRIQALLFDMDGVLIDSYQAWWLAIEAAVAHFGGPPLDPVRYRASWGQSTGDDCASFLPGVGVDALGRFYDEHLPRFADAVRVLPGARAALEWVRAEGRRCALVTNTRTALARELLEGVGLMSWFDVIVGDGSAARPKPFPDPVEFALERLATAPGDALFLGDSRYDVEAARAASVPVAVIGDAAQGDHRLGSLAELPELVRTLES